MTISGRIVRKIDTRSLLAWVVIIAAAFLAYAPSYGYDPARHEGFVWDDDDHFLNDPLIRAGDGWWRVWLDPQPGVVGTEGGAVVWNYWPLTRMSFWVDRHLWGTDGNGMPDLVAARLTNVGLHAANSVLLAIVLAGLGIPGAALAGLLFAVHPVAVESVAWITERKTLLGTLFLLVSFLGWARFEATGRARWYAFTLGAFFLTLTAKTSTVMFPVLLVLLHWYRRRPWTPRACRRLVPLFGMSLVAGVTSIVFERSFIGSQGEFFEVGLVERIATAGWIVWFYLGNSLFPIGLSFNYPRFDVDPRALASHVPTLAASLVAALLWRWREGWSRPLLLGLGSFLVNLFPVLGFFGIYGMRYAHVADHWLYLACASIVALQAAGFVVVARRVSAARPSLARPVRIAAGVTLVLLVSGLAMLTSRQSAAYVDRESLFRHTLERQPGSFLAHNNLGSMLLEQGRFDEAIAHFERAIEAEPGFAEPYANLGNALDAAGRSAEAALPWQQALERDPEQPIALYNLSVAHIKAGRLADAEALALRGLGADPRDSRALHALQYVYEQQGRGAAIEPFYARAALPRGSNRVADGRTIARAVLTAMTFVASAGIAWEVLAARRTGARGPPHSK